jgi:hypothetical protein
LDDDPENEAKRPVSDSAFEIAHMGLDEQDYPPSEGAVDIPDMSTIDTESSDGQGLGFLEESDGDNEKDEDYVMELEVDETEEGSDIYVPEEVHEQPKKSGKVKKTKVGSLSHPESSVSKPLVTTTLKLSRMKKNPNEATSAEQSTTYATTQLSQETRLLI